MMLTPRCVDHHCVAEIAGGRGAMRRLCTAQGFYELATPGPSPTLTLSFTLGFNFSFALAVHFPFALSLRVGVGSHAKRSDARGESQASAARHAGNLRI